MKNSQCLACYATLYAVAAIPACTSMQIQQAGTTIAPIVAKAAQDAVNSYVSTGTVNKATIASDALNGVAAIAQAYIGQPVTIAPLATGAGLSAQSQAVGKAIAAAIPVGTITQSLVNQLFAAATTTK